MMTISKQRTRAPGLAGVLAILLAVIPGQSSAAEGPRPEAPAYVPTVLITGANKGIGLEFARQYAARGARVIATARDPSMATDLAELARANPRVIIEKLDVTQHAAIDALAARYAETPIDVLINNAGVSGGMDKQVFGKLDYVVFEEVLQVNSIAPLKMAEAFLPSIVASRDKRIVAISSSEGSIGKVNSSRLYFMRASKAALNMEMKNLAFQLKPKGVSVAILNPGMVDTDFMRGVPKKMLRPPPDAVRDMMAIIDAMTIGNTGRFWNYDGATLPW